ncbi:MAG TPA: TraR/DksA C4-type zinc finger protein [Bryobacteraceae bacterium]|nr:TraR/DksA C4-type zinc finger protein [Bryobacteraceae bacterium]
MSRNARVREEEDSLEVYRGMLLARRQQVLGGLGAKFDTLARMGRVAEEDQAQISHDEFVSLRLNSLDYSQLRLIDEALDRIRLGDYGTCQSCEQAIPAKRLRVVPWARYCVPCQEQAASREEGEEFRNLKTPELREA